MAVFSLPPRFFIWQYRNNFFKFSTSPYLNNYIYSIEGGQVFGKFILHFSFSIYLMSAPILITKTTKKYRELNLGTVNSSLMAPRKLHLYSRVFVLKCFISNPALEFPRKVLLLKCNLCLLHSLTLQDDILK